MPDAARGLAAPWLKRSWAASAGIAGWLPVWSAPAALRGVRAAIVVSGGFAFTDVVIDNKQMAVFTAFGGFATLVMVSFAGTRRDKLAAHAGLAIAGSVLLTIGTVVASSTVLAALVTVPVTFVVFFAGVAGPNAASAVTGALLAYVLPAASPGAIGSIPDRLAGWWLASVVGTAAVLALSLRPGVDSLRAAASKLATALAEQIDAALGGTATDDQLAACVAAKHELMAQFSETPYRPIGLTAPDEALANGVELLEWCTTLVLDMVHESSDLRDASPSSRELLAAAAHELRDVTSSLTGADARADLDRLESSRAASVSRLDDLQADAAGARQGTPLSFHVHAIAAAVVALAADALVASRPAEPRWFALRGVSGHPRARPGWRTRQRMSRIAAVARRHASIRSVWLLNSTRGALALAAAVAVADVSDVQHGFWVVLGTLSVLRTNAASTGSTALRALAGTAVGFVIGGAFLLAIGSDQTMLWVALPIAVFVAGYAPGTAPFAVGQAAFTVTVAVLFNLLVPVGWKVGVVRIEDVAIGCAVSVVIGTLFWPRGVASVVGDDLADAFRSGASYLTQAIDWASGLQTLAPESAMAATAAATRLDDALRSFLAEQGSKRIALQELWRLVGGSMRLRLTAHSIAHLPRDPSGLGADRDVLEQRTQALAERYERLAELVGRSRERTLSALDAPTPGTLDGPHVSSDSRGGIWLCEYLDQLSEHVGELVRPATHVAELRRRPWWR